MRVRWLAVRCCCQPQRIFGFVPVEENVRTPSRVRIPMVPALTAPVGELNMPKIVVPRVADIRIESFGYFDEPAIYSEDRPIEFWREVCGFVEVAPCSDG